MITPRHTQLVRVPDLRAFHRAVARHARAGTPADRRATVVLVSTHAGAAQLRDTLENLLLLEDGPAGTVVAVWPEILTRDGWYEWLHRASPGVPRLLGALEREVLIARAAREAIAAGQAPPFHVRPALVAEMLGFLDTLCRLGRTLDGFERLLLDELEPRVSIDRGAAGLLRQTRFLVASFRGYRDLVAASGAYDEHLLREHLLRQEAPPPFTRVVVTAGDRSCGSGGLWPVDFDLLARLPRLEHVSIIATEHLLAAGLHERLHDLLPGIEEVDEGPAAAGSTPVLVAPAGAETRCWMSRDREEEIASIARRIKNDAVSGADRPPSGAAVAPGRIAIVCRRPLPYVYLAQSYLSAAGIPFQSFDDLPLAAEPFAAAVDLVFRFVESGFGRRPAVALLRSPHFLFADAGGEIPRAAIAAFELALREEGGAADAASLRRLAERGAGPDATRTQKTAAPVAALLAGLVHDLEPLRAARPASDQFATLLAFLERFARPSDGSPIGLRTARARTAVTGALRELGAAHRLHDDPPLELDDVASRVRRWMEAQTFAPRTGSSGVHLVDAEAARYGDFDETHIVGVIEREWPDREGRTIFYPLALLNQLGWPPERARLAAARAAFRDLVRLPRARVSVSAFALEDDALVEPSPFLDEIERSGLGVTTEDLPGRLRIVPEDALSLEPIRTDVLDAGAREWIEMRRQRPPFETARFHGTVSPVAATSFAVRRLEMYLDCPFKYFAESVLRLTDESDDDVAEGPRAEGQFLHEVLAAFFAAWQASRGGAITRENIEEARTAFAAVAEARLATLRPADAALWRARLLGSAARAGIGEIALRVEARQDAQVVKRLLEHRLDGPCRLQQAPPRTAILRGVADRIDVLEGNRLRIVDYKLGRAPDVHRAVQLPLYAVQAGTQLASSDGGGAPVDAAAYLAFGEREPYVSIASRGLPVDRAIAEGQARAVQAVEGIEAGEFPPRPAETFLCGSCAYAAVCRKDYVDGRP